MGACDGSTGGKAQIVLVDDVAYIFGNPAALEWTLGLTRAQARRYAGRWVSIPKGSDRYTLAADGLTLASIVHDASPDTYGMHLKVVSKRGTRLFVLWTDEDGFPGGGTLSARANGDPLPVAFTGATYPTGAYRGTFSKWNEPVDVQAPAHATPIATVCGGPCPNLGAVG